jgi:hypothetical protein
MFSDFIIDYCKRKDLLGLLFITYVTYHYILGTGILASISKLLNEKDAMSIFKRLITYDLPGPAPLKRRIVACSLIYKNLDVKLRRKFYNFTKKYDPVKFSELLSIFDSIERFR